MCLLIHPNPSRSKRNLGPFRPLLGGYWVDISGVISRKTIVTTTHTWGRITPLTTTHEPPSMIALFASYTLKFRKILPHNL